MAYRGRISPITSQPPSACSMRVALEDQYVAGGPHKHVLLLLVTSTSRHEKNRLQMGASVMAHAVVPSSITHVPSVLVNFEQKDPWVTRVSQHLSRAAVWLLCNFHIHNVHYSRQWTRTHLKHHVLAQRAGKQSILFRPIVPSGPPEPQLHPRFGSGSRSTTLS